MRALEAAGVHGGRGAVVEKEIHLREDASALSKLNSWRLLKLIKIK